MTKFKKTNKLPMEVILVNKGDQALPTGNFTTAGVALNLADGQPAVLSYDLYSSVRPAGEYVEAGDTTSEVQAIKVVMGTPASSNVTTADIWEARDKGYLESGVIAKDKIQSVSVKKPRYGRNGAQVLSAVSTPISNLEYNAYLRLISVRNDRYFGDNDEVVHATVPAVDFTALSITQPKDYVLQKLAVDFNKQSKIINLGNSAFKKGNRNFVVFGVNIAGGGGTAIGTIQPGATVNFMTDGGVTSSIVVDYPLAVALAQLVQSDANLIAASTIEVLNGATAGSAATVDALIVVGLDHTKAAAYDEIEQVRTRPELNIAGGFVRAGATKTLTTCNSDEGTGQGWKWLINWRHRAGLDVHTKQIQPHGDWFLEGKNYITEDWLYTSYEIEYFDVEETLTTREVSPKKVTLLFRAEKASAFTPTVTNIAAQIALGNAPVTIATSNGAGTGTASANVVADIEAVLTAWLEDARTSNPFTVTGDAAAGGTYLS